MARFMHLPRELRNMVYENLHESASFTWMRPTTEIQSVNLDCTTVPITNAVLPNLQASKEYMQADVFKNLEITIRMSVRPGGPQYMWGAYRPPLPNVDACNPEATLISRESGFEFLKYAKHLSIIIHQGYVSPFQHRQYNGWHAMALLMGALTGREHCFVTVKVGIMSEEVFRFAWSPQYSTPILGVRGQHGDVISTPPKIEGVSLFQQAQAVRLELESLRKWDNGDVRLVHNVNVIEAHLYACDEGSAKRRYWSSEDIMHVFPVRQPVIWDAGLLDDLDDDFKEQYTTADGSLKEWWDRRNGKSSRWSG